MITVEFDAAPAAAKLGATRRRLRSSMQGAMVRGAGQLLSLVHAKLSGEVLNVRSGALLRSIRAATAEDEGSISARVFSDGSVPYARIQEYGGHLNIPAAIPGHAKALAFAYGGRLVFAKRTAAHVAEIPARSYLRSSLDEFGGEFSETVHAAIVDSLP